MKTLLGIIASPRKLGNSELFVKELHRQLPSDWELELVRISDLEIHSCRGCYQCLLNGRCPQTDDFNIVLQSLIKSDAYVVAAPTYFFGPHSCLKNFLDRGLIFSVHIDKLWGKPAVGVAIAGRKGMEGYTKLAVESFIKLTFADLRGSAVVYGALPGEIFLENEGKEVAKELAEALLSGKERNSDVPTCPLCKGDTFRFLPDGQVRCMLCSNSGYYEWKENHLQCHIALGRGKDHVFLSYESVKQYTDWLREMKKKFLERRNELKAITQEYRQEGKWILPESDGTDNP